MINKSNEERFQQIYLIMTNDFKLERQVCIEGATVLLKDSSYCCNNRCEQNKETSNPDIKNEILRKIVEITYTCYWHQRIHSNISRQYVPIQKSE